MKKMKTIAISLVVIVPWLACAHHCPYDWNIELSQGLSFEATPVSNVLQQVNAAVRAQTKNRIKQAAILDTTPVEITVVTDDSSLTNQMALLIHRYHKIMAPLIAQGTEGYETRPVTTKIIPKFPLACQLSGISACSGMWYEETKDGAIFSRFPKELECRAYRVTEKLEDLMERNRRANALHVDAEPIVSALIDATGIHSWSVMVADPDGKGSSGETIYRAVFEHIPERRIILAITTRREHAEAQKRLKDPKEWEPNDLEGRSCSFTGSTTNTSTVPGEGALSAPPPGP